MPILPITPAGMPGARVISVQVSPPSVDLKSPEPGPPLQSCHGLARDLPERGVERARVVRIDREIDGAGLVVAEEHLLPGRSAVARAIDAARLAGAASDRRARPRRRDRDSAGATRRREIVSVSARPDVPPGLAGVDRPVDAVALHDVAAQLRLAHPDVDRRRVATATTAMAPTDELCDLAVGHRRPGRAAVGGLPQPAAGRAEVVLEGA